MSIAVDSAIGDYTLPPEVLLRELEDADMFSRFTNGDYERRIFLNVDLMPHELEAIEEVYRVLAARGVTLARQLEPRILRYLYHARFNVDRAARELIETQEWRLEYFKQPVGDTDLLRELNAGFVYVCGRDKQLRPCLVVRPSLLVKARVSKERAIRTSVFILEFITRYMLLPSKVESIVVIADFSGLGFDVPFSTAYALYKVLAHHYMGRMAAIYLVNLPSFLKNVVWNVARKLMTERQLQKNHVVTDLHEDLAKYFCPDQLEQRYGGNKEDIQQFYPITHLTSQSDSLASLDSDEALLRTCHRCLALPTVRGGLWRKNSAKEPVVYSKEAGPVFEALGLPTPKTMMVEEKDLLAEFRATQGQLLVPEGTLDDFKLDELNHALERDGYGSTNEWELKAPQASIAGPSPTRGYRKPVQPMASAGDMDGLMSEPATPRRHRLEAGYWFAPLQMIEFGGSISYPCTALLGSTMAIVVDFARPVLFTIFGRPVYGYGLCMALSFMSALLLGDGELKRKGLKIDSTVLLMCAMIGGILGSRFHFMLTWNDSSNVSFWDMSTGHSFQGGLVGGIVGTTGYTKLCCRESIGRMLDTLAPLLLIGHAIGKVGCFISGDGCYGYPTDVPWAMSFPNGLAPTNTPVHPAPLYEMITSGSCGLILWYRRKKVESVPLALVSDFFILLGSTRFFVERYRGHERLDNIYITQFQLFAVAFILVGLALKLAIKRGWISSKQTTEQDDKKKKARSNQRGHSLSFGFATLHMAVVVEFVRPVLFTVFGRPVYGYGLCMALSFMSALLLGDGELRRKGLKIDSAVLLMCAMIGGILGSRLHFMLTWNDSSNVSFWDMSTGHSFQGGLVGGTIGTTAYTKLYCRESVFRMMDTLAPLLLIGHAIGKVGCFISGDGCYGYPTDVPWAMSFPNGLAPTNTPVHPTPLYEMITSGGCGLILWYRRKKVESIPLTLMSDMLVLLGCTRFFVEKYRGHSALDNVGITQYQLFALAFVLIGLLMKAAISRGWTSDKSREKSAEKYAP
ncbi:hypothetical protein FOL47_000230 [Perkinsus chesapeaki]|uniref:CRAL-TRIO domain-containing protein n=1 Tax=Perkinsus chesapeaki TaxID=330153 RepID=A0A7J6MMW2_PERCH|nr:hypothetical protein FOL47_000230 [Perkinsus chesapeaki]